MKKTIILAPLVVLAGTFPAIAQTTMQTTTTKSTPPAAASSTAPAAGSSSGQSGSNALTGSYLREVDDSETLVGPGNMSVQQMENATIYDAKGKPIGEVEEVIANNKGQIVAVTAEVGTYFGLGDKEVLISITDLTPKNGQFVTDLTLEQVKALPTWDDD